MTLADEKLDGSVSKYGAARSFFVRSLARPWWSALYGKTFKTGLQRFA